MTTTGQAKTEPASRPLVRHASRLRLAVFMTLSYLSYAVVNAFWHYLATGRWIRISIGQFRTDLAQPLSEFLYEPLGVISHPWMILVCGLLLAVLIFVPIMIAVLYRLAFVAGLVLLVVLLGHAPVLALAIAVGAVVAARMPLRRSAPMIAVLAGLGPIAAYLADVGPFGNGAGRPSTAPAMGRRCPADRSHRLGRDRLISGAGPGEAGEVPPGSRLARADDLPGRAGVRLLPQGRPVRAGVLAYRQARRLLAIDIAAATAVQVGARPANWRA